jgi:hypothetical protein
MNGKRKPPKKISWFRTTFGSLRVGTIFVAFSGAATRMKKMSFNMAQGTDGTMQMLWEPDDPVWVPVHVESDFKG